MIRSLFVLLVLAMSLATRPVVAQAAEPDGADNADTAAARALFKEALAASKGQRWEEARDLLTRSLALKRAPITLYTLAVAERNTQRHAAALRHLHAFLASESSRLKERFVEPAKQAISELKPLVGTLTFAVDAGGSPHTVTVDDELVDDPSRPYPVDPGNHQVAASAAGHHKVVKTVAVTAAGEVTVNLVLSPAHSSPGPDGEDQGPSLWVPVSLMAGGALVFGGGLALGLVGVTEAEDAPAAEGEEADAARSKMLVGDIIAGVGIAGAATGLVLLLIQSSTSEADSSAAASRVQPWASGAAAGVTVRF